jgi:hypothetical protein
MSNSAFSQNAAPSSFADLTGVPDDNAALAAALAGKQDRTRDIITLTAIADSRTLDGTEDIIIATGVSPTSVFDPGTLPVVFCLEIRNDSSQNVAFNPFVGTIISVPPGNSVILRQTTAGSWVDLLAGKANLESPTFTGTPEAPTPAADDSTTKIATTAYVQGELAALGTIAAIRTGSTLAFDVPAVYNSAASPSNGTVTLDSTGAVAGTQIEAWFNHAALPSWPSGFTIVGVWNNSAANCVRITYLGAGAYSGVIENSATGASQTVPAMLTITGGSSISTTGTTAVALPGLSFTLPAGARRDVVMFLRVTCPAAGFRLGWWSSVGTDQLFNLYGGWGGATTEASLIASSGLNQLNASQAYIASSGTNKWIRMEGSFTGGAADSVMDLRFASVTNGQTTQIFLPSTHIMIWQ